MSVVLLKHLNKDRRETQDLLVRSRPARIDHILVDSTVIDQREDLIDGQLRPSGNWTALR